MLSTSALEAMRSYVPLDHIPTISAIVGAGWGDEGKGRTIDYLAKKARLVIRCQGGDNAGHTVVNNHGVFKLHLVPSGIFNQGCFNVLGAGTVVNPASLLGEMREVRETAQRTNYEVDFSNFGIDYRAHVLLPQYHRILDGATEDLMGSALIGSTRRGIAQVYGDKAERWGIRFIDLLNAKALEERLRLSFDLHNLRLEFLRKQKLDLQELLDQLLQWGDALRLYILDSIPVAQTAIARQLTILLEGQLAALRDVDWGIWPYVTSSAPTAAGLCQGAGIAPVYLTNVWGVIKAFSTCVGEGPFVTEIKRGMLLKKLRGVEGEADAEFGASTGRARRIGHYDAVAIGHSAWLNGFTDLAINKLDVLDGWDQHKICIAYEVDGERISHFPDPHSLARAKPVYEIHRGWRQSTRNARRWEDLPRNAQAYVRRIEELVQQRAPKARLRLLSVGPHRDQLIELAA